MGTDFLLGLTLGTVLGLALALILRLTKTKSAKELAEELYRENETQSKLVTDALIEHLKASFGNISLDTLSRATGGFLTLAKERLDTEREIGSRELESKKGLIDQELRNMTAQLDKVSNLVNELEKDRREKFVELTGELKNVNEKTQSLSLITDSLRQALAGSGSRGRLGELVAKRVLEAANLVEHVHYEEQEAIKSDRSRPDYTFFLPDKLKLNMDVKFPWDNYDKSTRAASEVEKTKCCNDFLQDVKDKIKEISTREEYINKETLGYVLLFIPSEQIYSFIWMQDSSIIQDALSRKVICCSPVTLLAVLAIIYQAHDTFATRENSDRILSLLGEFEKQWKDFLDKLDQLGKQIEKTQKDYEALNTTRRRRLEKPLNAIEAIRVEKGIPLALPSDEVAPAPDESSKDTG